MPLDSPRSIHGCADGSSAVEPVLVLCLVALFALGAFVSLGEAASEKVVCAATAIARLGGTCGAREASNSGSTRNAELAERRDDVAARRAALSGQDATAACSAGAYECGVRELVDSVGDHFGELNGDADGTIAAAELSRVAATDGAAGDIARRIFAQPSLANVLDTGGGVGGLDGKISRGDLAGFVLEMDHDALGHILADTAAGAGKNDGYPSRSDLEALAGDESVPEEVRRWARVEAGRMPEDEGCSWLDALCHAKSVVETTSSFAGGLALGVAKGIGRAVVGTASGMVEAGRLGCEYFVDDPVGVVTHEPTLYAEIGAGVIDTALRGATEYAGQAAAAISRCGSPFECGEAIGGPVGEVGVGIVAGRGAGIASRTGEAAGLLSRRAWSPRTREPSLGSLRRAYERAGAPPRHRESGLRRFRDDLASARRNGGRTLDENPLYSYIGPRRGRLAGDEDAAFGAAANPAPRGYTDVAIHGEPSYFVHGRPMRAKALARLLVRDGYRTGHIRLLSCSTGRSRLCGGPSAAQQLADELGATVVSPTRTIDPLHEMSMPRRGEWRVFEPTLPGVSRRARARARLGRALDSHRELLGRPEHAGAAIVILTGDAENP